MSRQNSRNVSSLEVTLNGSQIEIDPIGNGTKPFDDVKVMLVRGADGTGAESLALEFSTTTLYSYGDLCTKDALLYKCINEHGHYGAWDASDFEQVFLEDVAVMKTGDTMTGALRVDDTDYTNYVAVKELTPYDGKFTLKMDSNGSYAISYKINASETGTTSGMITQANRSSRYHVMVYERGFFDTTITEREVSSESKVTIDTGNPQMPLIVRIYKNGYSELSTEHLLADVVEDGKGNVLSEKLESSAFIRIIRTVTASNWSASPDANGFYTYTLNTYQNFHNEPTPKVYGSGANDTTLPTDAQAKAYEQIIFPNGYVEHYSVNTFKFYAKRKPTTDFYVVIEGIYWQ